MFFSTSQIDPLSAGKEPVAHGMETLSGQPSVCVSGGGRKEIETPPSNSFKMSCYLQKHIG